MCRVIPPQMAIMIIAIISRFTQAAEEMLTSLFPGYGIEMVPGREILLGGGNIHCITQQQPKTRGSVDALK